LIAVGFRYRVEFQEQRAPVQWQDIPLIAQFWFVRGFFQLDTAGPRSRGNTVHSFYHLGKQRLNASDLYGPIKSTLFL